MITCPAVQSVHQATANTNLAIFGTLVTLECTPGYEYPDKTTQKNTQCLDSGSWSDVIPDCERKTWSRFHEKSQTEPDSRLSQGLKSETFVSAEFLAQMDFTKGGSAETSLKLWSQLFNLISNI